MKVTQPSVNPTNKLTAAVLASFAVELIRLIANNIWNGAVDESFWIAVYPVAVFAAGWFVKDDANVTVPVVVQTPAQETGDGSA